MVRNAYDLAPLRKRSKRLATPYTMPAVALSPSGDKIAYGLLAKYFVILIADLAVKGFGPGSTG